MQCIKCVWWEWFGLSVKGSVDGLSTLDCKLVQAGLFLDGKRETETELRCETAEKALRLQFKS